MEQKDFILREIEKIGAMLRMLIRRRVEQKDTRDEEEKTEQAFGEMLNEAGIDLEEIIKVDKADFQSFFKTNKGFNFENTELLADFLVQLSENPVITDAILLRKKAMELYKYIDEQSKTFSIERAEKIKELLKNC